MTAFSATTSMYSCVIDFFFSALGSRVAWSIRLKRSFATELSSQRAYRIQVLPGP